VIDWSLKRYNVSKVLVVRLLRFMESSAHRNLGKTCSQTPSLFLGFIDTIYHLLKSLIPESCHHASAFPVRSNFPRTFMASITVVVLLLSSLACAAADTPTPVSTPTATPVPTLKVVATTTVLADLAKNIGGDLVEVSSLVPPSADVHSFQTTPSDSIAVGRARVIISNGFGLDDFLAPVIASAKQPSAVDVVAAEGLSAKPLDESPFPGEQASDQHDHTQEHASGDPHFWLDPTLAIHYVERIRDGLVEADPANAQAYSSNAETYIQELRDLDQEIAQTLSQVPPEHRHLVSFHDAFGYFGRRYGWEVSFFEPSDASDVTPGAVKAIVSQIQSEGIPAIFAEPQFAPDVLKQAAKDTGIKVGIIHSLPDSTAPTYIDMMRSNARSLVENLS
jgi:zinc transport system substrate-binding protein